MYPIFSPPVSLPPRSHHSFLSIASSLSPAGNHRSVSSIFALLYISINASVDGSLDVKYSLAKVLESSRSGKSLANSGWRIRVSPLLRAGFEALGSFPPPPFFCLALEEYCDSFTASYLEHSQGLRKWKIPPLSSCRVATQNVMHLTLPQANRKLREELERI